jgi:hypothetical protein
MSESSSSRGSGFPVWAIILIVVCVVIAPIAVVMLGCAGILFVGARKATTVPPLVAPAASTNILPFDPPYPTDYPGFEGTLDQLAPAKVGRFRRSESKRALDLDDAIATWSAFYKDDKDNEIHLRLRHYATSDSAYSGINSDAAASITTRIIRLEPYRRNDKSAGVFAYGQYHNNLKNVPADAIWLTIGDVAIVIGSKDGQFAEEFLKALEPLIQY